jgi:glycosyltransferase involved in cell wall biosynthesis
MEPGAIQMRVLHVVPSMSTGWTGLSRSVAGLSGALVPLGVRSCIVTTRRSRAEAFLTPEEVVVEVFDRGPFGWWGYARGLAGAIHRATYEADLVHVHGLWLYPHVVASRVARSLGKPYVVSPHGMLDAWALNHHRLRKRLYSLLFGSRSLRRATAIHAVSEAEARDARRLTHCSVFVVPNGIDAAEVQRVQSTSTVLRRYPILANRTILLFLGRVYPRKGLDILVEGFSGVAKRRDDVSLVVAGPDDEGYGLWVTRRLETEGLKDRVVITGMVEGDERLALLSSCDVFVLPSYSEGLPIAALEAMACGKPVILTEACNIPGVDEAGAGFIIPPTAEALAISLERMLESVATRREMGERARRFALSRYTWDQCAHRMFKAYKNILTPVPEFVRSPE